MRSAFDGAAAWAGRPPRLESAALRPGLPPVEAVGSPAKAVVGVLHSGHRRQEPPSGLGVSDCADLAEVAGHVGGGVVSGIVQEVGHAGIIAVDPHEAFGFTNGHGEGVVVLNADQVGAAFGVVIKEQAREAKKVCHTHAYTQRGYRRCVYALQQEGDDVGVPDA